MVLYPIVQGRLVSHVQYLPEFGLTSCISTLKELSLLCRIFIELGIQLAFKIGSTFPIHIIMYSHAVAQDVHILLMYFVSFG